MLLENSSAFTNRSKGGVMMNRFLLLLILTSLLSACTNEIRGIHDTIYQVPNNPMSIVVQPNQARVGEPVTVDVTATIVLDAESNFPEVNLLNTKIGICFARAEGGPNNREGLCHPYTHSLPPSYQLLNGSSYMTEVRNVTMRRGEPQTFKHTMTFTLDEPGELLLEPHLYFEPERGVAPNGESGEPTSVLFVQP